METDIKKILDYYLEYEIFRIISSSQIEIKEKNCIVIGNIEEKNICSYIEDLKKLRIVEKIEEFIGKKQLKKENIIQLIEKELEFIDVEQANKAEVIGQIKAIVKENIQHNKRESVISDFADELCDIKTSNEIWVYADNLSVIKKESKKMPMFILQCEIEGERINVIDVNINLETLYTALAVTLKKDVADVVVEYEENVLNYSKEIKLITDSGSIEHMLELYYSKLNEYVGLSIEQIKNINVKNYKYYYNKEYIISLDELSEEGIKNIKEDIELLNKLIDYDNYIPNLLNKYLTGNMNKRNINSNEYEKVYRGNYKSSFGVGQNQYRITNAINNNDLIAVEGPPGTGKTSLLKQIIANKIVERADLILKNWDDKFEQESYSTSYSNIKYYNIGWYNKNKDIVKSIVVSSKNGEAIENVGREINKEIRYMFHIARKYQRTEKVKNANQEKIEKKKVLQKYKGLICLPLGKQDNIKDFKDFLYQQFIPRLEWIRENHNIDKLVEKTKQKYEEKRKQINELEEIILELDKIENKQRYFYGIDVFDKKKDEEEIQKRFIKEKEEQQAEAKILENERNNLLNEKESQEENLKVVNSNIENSKSKISENESIILEAKKKIEQIKKEQNHFEKISKNIFTKILNYKIYKKYKKIDFFSNITELEIKNNTIEKEIEKYVKDKIELEEQQKETNKKLEELSKKYKELDNTYKEKLKILKEIEAIHIFNKKNDNKYWQYTSKLDMYCTSNLNKLNQELFTLALKLNEAYLVKNSEEIIENLKIFLADDTTYICKKIYDSSDIYIKQKREAIKSIWNTLFLCFPVVTTTLDSFCKKCFHLIPEYIDLELIDEAGQILPHNLVSAMYRAKKAVIVGDVNQIEPICNKVYKDFSKEEKNIGENFENIKIEENSIQALANKNTDILSDVENIILNDHYRCEKNIINFANENVYKNKLNMHVPDKQNKPFSNNMIALDVRGKKDKNENFNKVEVQSCIEAVKYIVNNSQEEPTIAIITPFKKQKSEIEDELNKIGIKNVKVGTVHAFQGQEKDYIIFSPIIDSSNIKWAMKFIGKKCNMLNVAVTRAKKQFIYLGNLNVAMQAQNYMTKLVKYIKKNGLVYSLYNSEDESICKNMDENIYKILQPELNVENDNIGLYINTNIRDGIITDAKQHYDFLKHVLKNTKKEIYIMAPWIRENVINDEFLNNIKKLKEKNCIIRIVFGYKNGNSNINNAHELAIELKRTNSLGFASQEEAERIIEQMYEIIGKENFIYAPPTHAKIIIIDNKYMGIGSHNWLSNSGKTNEKQRAKEATRLTTNQYAIEYAKEQFFGIKI